MVSCITGISCINPPEPPVGSGIVLHNYQGDQSIHENSTYAFDTYVTYRCRNGMRWRGKFDQTEINVACSEGNVWNLTSDDLEAWGVCDEGNKSKGDGTVGKL